MNAKIIIAALALLLATGCNQRKQEKGNYRQAT